MLHNYFKQVGIKDSQLSYCKDYDPLYETLTQTEEITFKKN